MSRYMSDRLYYNNSTLTKSVNDYVKSEKYFMCKKCRQSLEVEGHDGKYMQAYQ